MTARSTFATRMQAEMPPSGEESDFDWVYRITVSSSTQKPEDLFAPATLCGRNNPFNEQAYKKEKGGCLDGFTSLCNSVIFLKKSGPRVSVPA